MRLAAESPAPVRASGRLAARAARRSPLRADRAAGHRDSARLGGGRLRCRLCSLRARSFRSEARACSRRVPSGGWSARPAVRLTGHARRLSRAPRGTPHHARRAARCGCAVCSTRATSSAFLLSAYARRLGGRRCASRSGRQAAGVPGARGWRAGKRTAGRHDHPRSLSLPARKLRARREQTRSRMTPAATAAKSRYADGRPGAGEDTPNRRR